jgi:excisionase family DNA binding protein
METRMPDYMTVGETAKVCDVAADTVRWWDRTGRLKAARTSSGVRLFARRDVEAYAAERARRQQSTRRAPVERIA